MNLPKILLVFGLLASMIGSTLMANPPQDDKLFGNGRFLRRLTGRSEPPKAQPKKPAKVKPKTQPSKKLPTSGKAPTLARKPGIVPTLAKPSKTSRPTSMDRSPNRLPKPSVKSNSSDSDSAQLPAEATRSAKKPTIGFGMLLETRGKNMVVTQIDRKGNAYEAGVRTGDQVVGAGGVDLESLDDFNGITEILGQGDQLEINFVRRGKKQKMLIQFGEGPEEGEVVDANASAGSAPGPKTGKYDFVPDPQPAVGSGLRSVMQGNNQANRQLAPRNVPKTAGRMPNPMVNQTIDQQRRQIERMQREIERLRESQSAIEPATSVIGETILEGPALSGPKK